MPQPDPGSPIILCRPGLGRIMHLPADSNGCWGAAYRTLSNGDWPLRWTSQCGVSGNIFAYCELLSELRVCKVCAEIVANDLAAAQASERVWASR